MDTRRYKYNPTRPPENINSPEFRSWLQQEFNNIHRSMLSGDSFWEDMRFPMTTVKLGATSKPDYDYTNLGLLFPQNDTSEIVYINDQMSHSWITGSPIHPHIHLNQTSSTLPIFKWLYRFYNNGETRTPGWTTLTSSIGAFPYVSGTLKQILLFPPIELPAFGTSTLFDFKIYRDDNVVPGDVLVKSVDFHYQRDFLGSVNEYVK